MSKCHACKRELDQSSLEANRCSHCGAPVRKISQRTIEDKQNLRERLTNQQEESPDDLSSQATRLILPSDLINQGQTIEQGQSDTAGESANEAEAAQPPGQPSDPDRHSPTVGDQSDLTMEFQPPGDMGQPVDEAEESSRRSTHTVQKDATIDLDMTSAEAQTLDSQWRGTFDLGTGQGQTIRQKETVSGFRSSLPVKSRYIREKRKAVGLPPKTPADVPDYELLDIIGEGGMGVVYAAHQSSIARTVAVKMLKPSTKMREDQRDKFISEAVVTGELDHPNIVPIYDLGANDEGALFYSMKRVRGTPWDKVLHRKQLDENLSILMRVADAVAFAHAGGVIHRDLKPENVMLGDFGEVLVMDWGLARITLEFAHVDTVYQADSLGGTPAYMSPEMARGPVERINKTSDIYLLGAMLYEIIGGIPPHSGRDVMQCLMAASQNRIDPVRYEGELKDIALKAMATRQEDRYQTVKEFQAAILVYQSHSESLVLTAHSNQNLQKARQSGDYQLFARALYGFQESLTLWDANQRAKALLVDTQRDYADAALKKGDLDLAASLLQPGHPDHEPLVKKIDAARAERDARQRRLRMAKRAVVALVALVVASVTMGLVLVNIQRNKAVAAQKEAEKQRGIAETNAQEAIKQKGIAETNANEAIKQKGIAETNAEEAIKQKGIAETNEREAVKQRKIAEDAKVAEEYESYVAQIGLASAKIDENAYDYALQLLEESQPALRNWEWGRLVHLCRLSRSFNADGPVQAVAYSPAGNLFATGGLSGDVAIRDAATGAVRHPIKLDHAVLTLAYSPNGQYLAAGMNDGTIRIYELGDEGIPIEEKVPIAWKGHADGVLTVRFSPDGQQLLTGSLDNTARLWDLATGREIQSLIGHSWWVWAAEFSPNGNRIVTAGQDGKAIVWEKQGAGSREQGAGSRERGAGNRQQLDAPSSMLQAPSYHMLTEFTGHNGALYAARFSPKGDLVATGGYDNSVMIWNPDEVKPIDIRKRLAREPEEKPKFVRLAGHDKPVRSLAFSPNGQLLASGSDDNSVRLWDVASGAPLKALRGHSRAVRSAEFSIDGSQVLSGSEDQSVRIWNIADYQEVRVLHATVFSGHEDAVLAARFSRDGKQVVTASRDRTASLWDAASGRPLRRFDEGHEFLISGAAFFPDGKHIATGAGDNSVRIWDLMAGTEKLELSPTGRIGTLAVSPDGNLVATGSQGTDVKLWNANTGELVATLSGHTAEVASLAFSPDGQRLATGDDRGNLRIWSRGGVQPDAPAKWEPELELAGHNSSVTSIRFTPDGQRLVTSSGDRTCTQWDLTNSQELRELVLRHPEWVSSLDISPDGTTVITACDDGFARLWRLADAALLAVVRSPGQEFNWGAISPDGSTAVLTSTEEKRVWLWDLSAARVAGAQPADNFVAGAELLRPFLNFNPGGEVWMAAFAPDGGRVLTLGGNDAELWNIGSRKREVRFSAHGAVASAAVSPNGRLIATGSWDHSAKIWDAETGQAIRKLEGEHTGQVNSVEFSPDGAQLLTASDDKTACLWDVESGKVTGKLIGHEGRVIAATYSPDGTRVLTVSSDTTARVWDRATGNLVATLKGHTRAVLCGQFSADNLPLVITGSRDGKAKIWDVETQKMLVELAGHTAAVTAVAFSPDGTRAITGSQDNTCKLWDADPDKNGKEILTLPGHTQEVTSVSFSPDGRNVLTSSRDGTAVIWLAESWRDDAALQAARGQ